MLGAVPRAERVDDDAREELIHRLGDAPVPPARKNSPTSFLDGATPRPRFARSVGRTRPEASARNAAARSSAVVADLFAASLGSLQWVLAALAQTVLLVLLSVGLGAEVVEARGADDRQGRVRHRGGGGFFGVLSFVTERHRSGRVRGRVARSKDRWRAESDGSRLRGV